MSRIYTGNCLLGALYLAFQKRSWRIRVRRDSDGWPHLYVLSHDGAWHFRYLKPARPLPFGNIWFKGYFDRLPERLVRRLERPPAPTK